MVLETECTKCNPVDIKSDLFKVAHKWAYLIKNGCPTYVQSSLYQKEYIDLWMSNIYIGLTLSMFLFTSETKW
jgi:predicted Zn-dependent protease